MAAYLFSSLRVIDPTSSFHLQEVDLLVDQNGIQQIGPAGSIAASEHTQVSFPAGACVSPGWVDLHAHLQDPGSEHKESMEDLAEAAWKGGFTRVLCQADIEPLLESGQIMRGLLQRSAGLPTELMMVGLASEHAEGKDLAELYDMHKAGAKAFGDGLKRFRDAGMLLRVLEYLKSFDGLLLLSPLDQNLVPEGQINEGPMSARLGMRGIPMVSEIMAVAQDLALFTYSTGRVHYQPITSVKAIRNVHAFRQQNDMPLSMGLPVYYFAHTDTELESFDTLLKVMPPFRNPSQLAELKTALAEGLINTLSSGHQAQGLEEKEVEFALADPGIHALMTCYSLAQEHLMNAEVIDLGKWIELISHNPRSVLGLAPQQLEVSSANELTFFHPDQEWELTEAQIPSRAKNSPHLNKSLKGKVLGTFSKGAWRPLF